MVVPVVYFGEWNGALVNGVNMAFVPGLANVQPANSSTIVFPKPYGPRANGDDVFESAVSSIIGPLAAKFADDWELYHILVGEVHCATAAKRQVPTGKWWEYQP